MAKQPLPSPEELRQLLDYDPNTGRLTWRERDVTWFRDDAKWPADLTCRKWNARYAGKEAFTAVSTGYRVGRLNGRNLLAHRVIWAMETGDWPEDEIDHRDHARGNNRWENLREATDAQNSANKPSHPKNTSGFKGVSWNKNARKWSAELSFGRTKHYLGLFSTADLAAEAYNRAAERIHGEFAQLNPRLNDRIRREQAGMVYD